MIESSATFRVVVAVNIITRAQPLLADTCWPLALFKFRAAEPLAELNTIAFLTVSFRVHHAELLMSTLRSEGRFLELPVIETLARFAEIYAATVILQARPAQSLAPAT